MSTRHLVEPQALAVLDAFVRIPLSEDTLVEARALGAERTANMASQLPQYPNIEVSERIVPGPDGAPDVRVLIYTPKNRQGTVGGLLWIHGGGYIVGSVEGSDPEVKTIVDRVGCVVVSVDYRLAPETRAPGAAEDCYAALKWFHQHAAELGVDPTRLAIGGDSAGGGLTAAVGLITRDRAEVPLVLQVLIYPMLDDRTVTRTDQNPYVGEFVWTPELNRLGWTCHLGQEPGSEGISYYAAPARAEDLSGLPPTFISVGSLDLFLEEDIEYARRLMRAGVPTELHVYPGGFHGYMMAADAWISKAYFRDYQAALDRALNPR